MTTINDDSLDRDKRQKNPPLPGFISYEAKGGSLYGRYFNSTFVRDGKVYHSGEYLGKVIDKERGLFKNRERGYFTFNLENGYGEPDPQSAPLAYELPQNLALNFGDIWLVDQTLKKTGLDEVLNNLIPNGGDTLKSLVSFRLLESHPDSFAEEWYNYSYARILYPGANLESNVISSFQTKLGCENIFNKFFSSYLTLITDNKNINDQVSFPVLIDSAGLPNDIKTRLTSTNNHNGIISNQIRFIYVVDKITKLPIYFYIVNDNIIDNSVLISIINSLNNYNIIIKLLIMDTDYYSTDYIFQLIATNISFITMMTKNWTQYKQLMEDHGADLKCLKNAIQYMDRYLYGKKVPFKLFNKQLYAYIILDLRKENEEIEKQISNYCANIDKENIIEEKIASAGRFILISSDDYDIKDILPLYYTQQSIEQVFNLSNNFYDILQLRDHAEETIKGRILIDFIATIVYSTINHGLVDSKIDVNSAIYTMHNLKIKIYESISLLEVLTKQQKEIFQYLNLDCPFTEEKGNLLTKSNFLEKTQIGTKKKDGDHPPVSTKKTKLDVKSNLNINFTDKRKPGRPKGSKNKDNTNTKYNKTTNSVNKQKRGRPKGSKNNKC
jgi:hypothetical protein